MSVQMGLPGFDPLPISSEQQTEEPRTSFFFALYPTEDVAKSIAAQAARLCRERGFSAGLRPATLLHVTLHYIGNTPPEHVIAGACKAADSVGKRSFNVVFDRALSFGGDAFVLCGSEDGVAELVAFRGNLGVAMEENGLVVKRRFTPHMTIAYKRQRFAQEAIELISWRAEKLVLVKSHVGQRFHEMLKEWPLGN